MTRDKPPFTMQCNGAPCFRHFYHPCVDFHRDRRTSNFCFIAFYKTGITFHVILPRQLSYSMIVKKNIVKV